MQLKENASLSDEITVRIDFEKFDVCTDDGQYCGNELYDSDNKSLEAFEKAASELGMKEEIDYSGYVTSPEDGPSEHDFDSCHTGLFKGTVGDLKKMIEDYGVDPDILYVVHDGYRIFDVNSLVFDADE